MTLKKAELYRGFNLFTEEVRAGAWRAALVEVPASDGGERSRTPQQGRLLVVVFEYQGRGQARVITGWDMKAAERHYYQRHRKE